MGEFVHVYNDGGGIRNVPMREGATRFTTTRVLHQSGIPFWIPPGDGGSNGFSFTGTRGVFTLSAEVPLAGIFSMFALGGYCYLPAGAGGLVTGGWYWFRMTDGTNGEVFAETYSGTGLPAVVSSPTALPNLSAGRITQSTAELTMTSFILPGNAMGPNGLQQSRLFWATNSTSTKTVRLRVGSDLWVSVSLSTSNLIGVFTTTRQNAGNAALQIGNRTGTATGAWDGGASASAVSGNFTTTDTTTDKLCSVTGQISSNTASLVIVPMQFTVEYGA